MIRNLSSFFLFFVFAFQALAGTTGGIRGVVSDATTKEPLGGVTVIATSPVLQGEIATLSDEQGLYTISNLPAGVYTISAVFAGATSQRKGVLVEVDKTVGINVAISISLTGEVYNITDKAPNVDVATATVGISLSKEYIENVPTGRGRDFSNAISVVGSAGQDSFGSTVGGATSPENNYIIDGLNVTDTVSGRLFTHLTLDFVDQFEVKEGGYGPEYGRATGGLVNVVTKSGSNDLHGSVFATYRPGWLQLDPRQVSAANSTLVTQQTLNYYLSTGFEVGGPIMKDVLWFHIGYAPEILSNNNYQNFRSLVGDAAAGPTLDAFGNQIFEDTGFSNNFPEFWHTHQYTFKITHLINNNTRQSLNVRGSPSFFQGPLGTYGDPGTFLFTRKWRGNVASAIYNFAGKYFNDKLKVDADLGVNNDQFHSAPSTDIGASAAYIGVATTQALATVAGTDIPDACKPVNNFADGTSRCPVTGYGKGGFGPYFDTYYTRLVEKVALTNLFEFSGLHQLKYGIDFEQVFGSRYDSNTGDPGFKGTFTYASSTNRFIGTLPTQNGLPVDATHSVSGELNYGAFLGDTWNPMPSLILNYGVRWEGQDLLGVKSPSETIREHKFSIMGNIAPRAGFVWDFTKEGKGALRFNYGRFYESVPMDLLEREFASVGSLRRRFGNGANTCFLSGWDPATNGPVTPGDLPLNSVTDKLKVTNPAKQCKPGTILLNQTSEDALVVPGVKGQYSDEFVMSFDYEPFSSWVFGVAGIYRTLGRVVEDISTDGGSTFVIANPGDFQTNSLQDIKDQIGQEQDPVVRAHLQKTLIAAEKISTFPNPVRNYWEIQFKLDKKLSDNFLILATYAISWSRGNYPGLFSSNNGQLDPNITSQFDLPQLLLNRLGYLQQDQRHRIKVSGFYKASLKDLFASNVPLALTLGMSGRVESGKPYEVLGADEAYGTDEAFLLPRGSGGRMPWTWSVDVNFGTTYNFCDNLSLEVFAEIYNIFNRRDPTNVDAAYTFDFARPIVGGDINQLKYALNTDGNPIAINPNYGNATAYQDPLSAQFGVRLKF